MDTRLIEIACNVGLVYGNMTYILEKDHCTVAALAGKLDTVAECECCENAVYISK